MATALTASLEGTQKRPITRLTWANLAQGETGQRARVDGADLTVTVTGTFGGATVTLLGTNVAGGTGIAVKDIGGAAAISLTAAGSAVAYEVYAEIWPVVTGGGGTTDLTVTLLAR